MALTLEEIKKLPPRQRLEKLKEFEEEQKKIKKEEEEIVNKSLDEITKEKEREEEEEKVLEKEKEEKRKKEESLEQIAQEAKPLAKEQRDDSRARHEEYVQNLSRKPMAEIYTQLSELRENFEERGYLTQQQANRAQNLTEAVYQKEKTGYQGTEKARFLMTEAEKIKEEMQDIFKATKRYK